MAPILEDVQSVPGIGPAAATALKARGVTNTFQLIGTFMALRKSKEEQSGQDLCNEMWFWLKESGISAHRAGVVAALAEKVSFSFP